jgi:protein SCO1/2
LLRRQPRRHPALAIDGRSASRRSRPVRAILAILLAHCGIGAALFPPGGIPRADAAAVMEPHHFTLTTLDGVTVTDESYGGKWLVVSFGYTSCPDDCPTALTSIGATLDALGPLADKVQPLFVIIDPARDKARVMTAYLTSFGPRVIGLLGTPDQLEDTKKQFHVHYEPHRLENGSYGIDHTGFLYILGPAGEFAKLDTIGNDVAQRLAAELRRRLE